MHKRFALGALAAGLVAAAVLALTAIGSAAGSHGSSSSSPAAIAVVSPNNSGLGFVTNNGFATLTSPATGIYCLLTTDPSNIKPTKRPALLTIVADTTSSDGVPAWRRDANRCPNNKYYEVLTYDQDTLVEVDRVGFVIVVE